LTLCIYRLCIVFSLELWSCFRFVYTFTILMTIIFRQLCVRHQFYTCWHKVWEFFILMYGLVQTWRVMLMAVKNVLFIKHKTPLFGNQSNVVCVIPASTASVLVRYIWCLRFTWSQYGSLEHRTMWLSYI